MIFIQRMFVAFLLHCLVVTYIDAYFIDYRNITISAVKVDDRYSGLATIKKAKIYEFIPFGLNGDGKSSISMVLGRGVVADLGNQTFSTNTTDAKDNSNDSPNALNSIYLIFGNKYNIMKSLRNLKKNVDSDLKQPEDVCMNLKEYFQTANFVTPIGDLQKTYNTVFMPIQDTGVEELRVGGDGAFQLISNVATTTGTGCSPPTDPFSNSTSPPKQVVNTQDSDLAKKQYDLAGGFVFEYTIPDGVKANEYILLTVGCLKKDVTLAVRLAAINKFSNGVPTTCSSGVLPICLYYKNIFITVWSIASVLSMIVAVKNYKFGNLKVLNLVTAIPLMQLVGVIIQYYYYFYSGAIDTYPSTYGGAMFALLPMLSEAVIKGFSLSVLSVSVLLLGKGQSLVREIMGKAEGFAVGGTVIALIASISISVFTSGNNGFLLSIILFTVLLYANRCFIHTRRVQNQYTKKLVQLNLHILNRIYYCCSEEFGLIKPNKHEKEYFDDNSETEENERADMHLEFQNALKVVDFLTNKNWNKVQKYSTDIQNCLRQNPQFKQRNISNEVNEKMGFLLSENNMLIFFGILWSVQQKRFMLKIMHYLVCIAFGLHITLYTFALFLSEELYEYFRLFTNDITMFLLYCVFFYLFASGYLVHKTQPTIPLNSTVELANIYKNYLDSANQQPNTEQLGYTVRLLIWLGIITPQKTNDKSGSIVLPLPLL